MVTDKKPAGQDLANSLSRKIDEMSRYVSRDFMRELSKDELTLNQYNILRLLDFEEAVPMGKLAAHLSVTAPAITTMVDKLEKAKYLKRLRDSRDRRKVNVSLTSKGEETIGRTKDASLKVLRYLLDRMTEEERKSWLALYDRIISLLRKRAEEGNTAL